MRYDPMMIVGFILGILCLAIILVGVIAPRYYDVFVPPARRHEGTEETVPCEVKYPADSVNPGVGAVGMEDIESPSAGQSSGHDQEEKDTITVNAR